MEELQLGFELNSRIDGCDSVILKNKFREIQN